tara:strand:- start:709 stop:966 length:258 start_codon:yes stop_codon:yes gene_type:complete
MDEIKPVHHVTKEECERMIDNAINKHNRNASIISMCLGIIFLALFAEGFFRVIGMIPPFMGIDVDMMQDIIDRVKEEVLNVVQLQ